MHKQSLLALAFLGGNNLNILLLHIVVPQWYHVLIEFKGKGSSVGNSEAKESIIVDAGEHLHKAAAGVLVRCHKQVLVGAEALEVRDDLVLPIGGDSLCDHLE